jgi:hypothetical protein
LPSIKTFADVTVNKIIYHTKTHKTLKEEEAQFVPEKATSISPFKLQNRIKDTESFITGMVVTEDNLLLICEYSCDNSKLVVVYYSSGNYMNTIDVSHRPWDLSVIPRTHRAS